MVLVQVFRESIDNFILIFGATNADGKDIWWNIPMLGIIAVIVELAKSCLILHGLVELDIQRFFFWSSVMLIMFSAGLASHAFHELKKASWLGSWNKSPKDWWKACMWSMKECFNGKENELFAFLRAIFWYQDTPTFLEWSPYFVYWILIVSILQSYNWAHIRASRTKLSFTTKTLKAPSLCVSFVVFIFVLSNETWNGVLTMTLVSIISAMSTLVVFDTISHRNPRQPFVSRSP